ncbi:MAG: hypothetical protein ACTHJ5_13930 [Ilyomonas sp.]
MEKNVEIMNEMKQISGVVAAIGNANVYTAPAGYFESLSEEVLVKVQTNVNLPVTSLPLSQPPVDYFNDLASNILLKIKAGVAEHEKVVSELEEVAPLLNTINKRNVYSIPDDYFGSLHFFAPAPAETQSAKVVSFSQRRFSWLKYAVAAVTAGIVVAGAYLFIGDRNGNSMVANAASNITQKISTLSDKEITDYLNNETAEADIVPVNYKMFNSTADIEGFLQNISTEEIKSYLGSDKETAGKKARGI